MLAFGHLLVNAFCFYLAGAYYCLNMIMITLSTFLAVVVIHMYFRGPRTNRVPQWVKQVRVYMYMV